MLSQNETIDLVSLATRTPQKSLSFLADEIGASQSIYVGGFQVPNSNGGTESWIHTPVEIDLLKPSWKQEYHNHNLGTVDPVIHSLFTKRTAQVWNSKDLDCEATFKERTLDFGIKAGITIPVFGQGTEFGLISFLFDKRSDQTNSFKKKSLSDLHFFSHLFHQERAKDNRAEVLEDFALTPRQLDILNWVTIGKTNNEISEILGLRVGTVQNHIFELMSRTRSLNRTQLVSRCLSLGVLSI